MQGVFPYIQLSTPDLSNVAQDWLPIKTMVPGTEVVSLPKKIMGPVVGVSFGCFNLPAMTMIPFHPGKNPWSETLIQPLQNE